MAKKARSPSITSWRAFNQVVNPLKNDDAYKELKKQSYMRVPRIVSITVTDVMHQLGDANFSPEAIKKRAHEGYAQTKRALQNPIDPCADI